MPSIQNGTAATNKISFGGEHGKPRNLIANKDHPLRVDSNRHGMKQVANLANEFALLIEQLDSIILSITDDNVAILQKRDAVGRAEFSRTCARGAPAFDQPTVGRKAMNLRVALTVGNENISVRCDLRRRGMAER